MHDSEGKPVLLCSCNDNTVHVYDLPSWVSNLIFSTCYWFLKANMVTFRPRLDFLQGERCTQRKRFAPYKSGRVVYFSLAMEPVKLEYGSGRLNQPLPREKHIISHALYFFTSIESSSIDARRRERVLFQVKRFWLLYQPHQGFCSCYCICPHH